MYQICSDSILVAVNALKPGMRIIINEIAIIRFERGWGVDNGKMHYYDGVPAMMADFLTERIGCTSCTREDIFPD